MKKLTYHSGHLPLWAVNVLEQVRKTFELEPLYELADDIFANGVLQPSIVVNLRKKEAEEYLCTFNKINNTKVTISELKKYRGSYYLMLAGERRFRAHKILSEEGCYKCRNGLHKLVPGKCFESKFKGQIEVRVCESIDAVTAKSIQFRENNHVRPPAHEEAESYLQFFQYLTSKNHELSLAKFAREYVGVGSEKVRRAFWFMELPEWLQKAVKEKAIKYGHAVELRKLIEAFPERKVYERLLKENFHYITIKPKLKVETLRERIKTTIDLSRQQNFFSVEPISEKQVRGVIDLEFVHAQARFADYISRVNRAHDMGLIGRGKLFSEMSVRKQLMKTLQAISNLIPEFKLTEEQIKAVNKFPGKEIQKQSVA